MIKLRTHLNENRTPTNHITQEKGASNWLTAYCISDQGYDLNIQQFWDSLCLRYEMRLRNIPLTCSCGSKKDIQHTRSCKKGEFFIGHNDIRDLTANLLTEACKDVDIEPKLLPITCEISNNRTASPSDRTREQESINDQGILGERSTGIFCCEVIWPKRQSVSEQSTPSMLYPK